MPGRPTTLNRAEVMKAVSERWYTPCSDGMVCSYLKGDKGQVHVDTVKTRLWQAGKLPGERLSDWNPVILPDKEYDFFGWERGFFIKRDNDGKPIPLPGVCQIPPELIGNWQAVPFYDVGGKAVPGKLPTPDGLVDCAHFVSDCLRQGNGGNSGIQIQPYVPSLLVQLRGRSETRTLGLRVTQDQAQRILDTGVMEPGDVIIFTDGGKDHHSSIYTGIEAGKHRVACHTVATFKQYFFDKDWSLDQTGNTFTLITFDLPLIAAMGKPLRAEVRVGGVSEVYYLYSNGVARRSRGTRDSHQPPSMHPQDHGYWFNQAFDAFVFWTMTGQVVTIPQRVDFYSDFSSASSMYVNSDGISGEMIPFPSDE